MAATVKRISLMRQTWNRGPIDPLNDIIGLGDVIGAPLDINVEVEAEVPAGTSAPETIPVTAERYEPGTKLKKTTRFTQPLVVQARRVPGTRLYRGQVAYRDLWTWAPDSLLEVATIVRDGGSSDRFFRAPLVKKNWSLRGIGHQPHNAGTPSGSLVHEEPDALRLFFAGGVEVLRLSVRPSSGERLQQATAWGFIRSPADVLYYSGHGVFGSLATEGGLQYWVSPKDLFRYWGKSADAWRHPYDLKVLVIAGCSVLDCDRPDIFDKPTGPYNVYGLNWAELLANRNGPLKVLLGYRGKAALDTEADGGNVVAARLGTLLAAGIKYDGLARGWLELHQRLANKKATNAVAIDTNGYWVLEGRTIVGPKPLEFKNKQLFAQQTAEKGIPA